MNKHAQVHQFDFCAAGGASGEANNEAVSNLAGVMPGHLLMAEWNSSIGRHVTMWLQTSPTTALLWQSGALGPAECKLEHMSHMSHFTECTGTASCPGMPFCIFVK